MNQPIIFSIILLSFVSNSLAIDMPSDEEMIRQGRATVGELMPKMSAPQLYAPMTAATPMKQPEHLSPLAKELMKETLDAKLHQTTERQQGQPDLIVFVSFSMPDHMLEAYSKQANEAGATLVLRGLIDNSITKTQLRAATVNPSAVASWEINPGAFRKFKIDQVPSIVLVDEKADVERNGCAVPSDFIRIDGDISIRQALNIMRLRGDGRMALLAGQKLKTIEGQ